MLAMPISAQSLCLALTYHRLAGSSPTRIVPRPGTTPRSASLATRSRSSALISARVAVPFRICAVMSVDFASRRARLVGRLGAHPSPGHHEVDDAAPDGVHRGGDREEVSGLRVACDV